MLRQIIEEFPTEEPVDVAAVSSLLRRLRNVLAVHLRLEDEHLYPALERASDRALQEMASVYRVEMGGLSSAFKNFSNRWPDATAIAANPGLFLLDWQLVRDPLLARIDLEDHSLYDLADAHFRMRNAPHDSASS